MTSVVLADVSQRSAVRGPDHGDDLVGAAAKALQHGQGVGEIARFSKALSVHPNLGVGRQEDFAGLQGGDQRVGFFFSDEAHRFLIAEAGGRDFCGVGGAHLKGQPKKAQELLSAGGTASEHEPPIQLDRASEAYQFRSEA